MSQSDYIRYKRTAYELRNQSENLLPVIESGQYIKYKAFTLENTITSNKDTYTKLQPSTSVNVFGIQRDNPSSCPRFILCSGTDERVNKKPLSKTRIYAYPLPIAKPHKTVDQLPMCQKCDN
jgi:hypothetical protein